MYSPCTHVIFDMDGLLINTEDLYTDAFQAVLDEFQIKYRDAHEILKKQKYRISNLGYFEKNQNVEYRISDILKKAKISNIESRIF